MVLPFGDPVLGSLRRQVDIGDGKRAEEAVAWLRDEQATLYEFTDSLFRALSPEDVYEAALVAIRRALGCDRTSILLLDDAGAMRFVAWTGLSEAYRCAVDGHSPWSRDVRDPEPICFADVDASDLTEALKTTVKAEGIGAVAFIPLVVAGDLIGKFMAYYPTPHNFTRAEINLAVTIARQLGFGIQRNRSETERMAAQRRQDLLVCELQHRTKNLFAVVQSVVARSFVGKTTVAEAQSAVMSRLTSLGKTHLLLMDQEWQGAGLAEIVQAEMNPFGDRVLASGPSLLLSAKAAQNFALALHELVTNAAKYGSLSNTSGRVYITWTVTQENGTPQLTFRWQERGGPPVAPSAKKGFGSAVLEQVMGEYFDDPPRIDFATGGLCYELSGSLASVSD